MMEDRRTIMAMANIRRVEILIILSMFCNSSILLLQILTAENSSKAKTEIEIVRTAGIYGKDARQFRHDVISDERIRISKRDDIETNEETVNDAFRTADKRQTARQPMQEDNTNRSSARHEASAPVQIAMNNFCKEGGENLDGQKRVDVPSLTQSLHFIEALSVTNGGDVEYGGWWRPKHCVPRVKVAILLPYRKREEQLQVFLLHMHPIFQRQLLAYRIFVIEQVGEAAWNKGSIYNIGFEKAQKIDDFDCYIFHDIDLLAENDKNFYGCPFTPAHLSVAIDKFNYKLPYKKIFGGVEAFSPEEYRAINGFSNMYWGWGGEDDDLYTRVIHKGFELYRPSADVARYTMNKFKHFRSNGINTQNQKMYRDKGTRKRRMDVDGLNKVSTLKFTYQITEEPLFTRIAIDLQRFRVLKV